MTRDAASSPFTPLVTLNRTPPAPTEPDRVPDDFELELSLGLALHLTLSASGQLSLAYGTAPTLSPVAATRQQEVAYLTWSSSIPRERVQGLWAVLRLGAYRQRRMPLRDFADGFRKPPVAGVRIVANAAVSDLPVEVLGDRVQHGSRDYFEVLDALSRALGKDVPQGVELDWAFDRLREQLQRCVHGGGEVQLTLELQAPSGKTQELNILRPEAGPVRSCAERAARKASFPRLGGTGSAHIELRTRAQDASLEVATDVPADLQIDDTVVGQTNQRVLVAPGKHRLLVIASGRQSRHESNITLSSGDRVHIDLRSLMERPPVPSDLEIGIVRNSREGRHPAYSVRVNAVGSVRYHGYRHVRMTGAQEGKVEPERVWALWQSYLDLAETLKPERPAPFVSPRLFGDGPSVRVVVRALGRVATLDLHGSAFDVAGAMRVAELAHEIDSVLGSQKWTNASLEGPRCAFETSLADLKVRLEDLVRTRCGADHPVTLQVDVLGESGVVGRVWSSASDACLRRLVPLLPFPRCDVPSYTARIALFGPDSGAMFRGTPLRSKDEEFTAPPSFRPGLGERVDTLAGDLTLLHVELSQRILHEDKTREAGAGRTFVLAHLRFSGTYPGAQLPELALEDRWGARWPRDQHATSLLASNEPSELSTVVFEVPARDVLGARDFAWSKYEGAHARSMELHENVRLVVIPESGAESVVLPVQRIAVTSALQNRWLREARWIADGLAHVRAERESTAHTMLPGDAQWLRIDHALSRTSDPFVSLTLRRDPSEFKGSDALAGLRLAFTNIGDDRWALAKADKVQLAWAEPAGWSRPCAREEEQIVAQLRAQDAEPSAGSCSLHGFVAPWDCLAAFVPSTPEEALRLRMEAHRSQCGPRDPLLEKEP